MRKTAVALPDLLAPKKFRILLNSNFQNQFQNIRKFKKKNRETKIDKQALLAVSNTIKNKKPTC